MFHFMKSRDLFSYLWLALTGPFKISKISKIRVTLMSNCHETVRFPVLALPSFVMVLDSYYLNYGIWKHNKDRSLLEI